MDETFRSSLVPLCCASAPPQKPLPTEQAVMDIHTQKLVTMAMVLVAAIETKEQQVISTQLAKLCFTPLV